MMKLLFFILTLANNLLAYEKIDFIGSVVDNNIQNSVATISKDNKTYILSKNFIYVYDSSFSYISSIAIKTMKNASFTFGDGLFYVLDYSIPAINVYNEKGEFLFSFGSKAGKMGSLSSPQDIKYFSDGKIYVANTGLSRIEVFDKNGIYLYGFNTLKSDGLTRLNPSKICFDKSGFLYLTDPDKAIIQKYDRLGRLIIEKNHRADAIAVNEFGIIYIADEKEAKIKELNEKMDIIKPFGTKGKGKFEFLSFTDLFINSQNQLLILDKKNKKLLCVELENSSYTQKLSDFINLDKIMLSPVEILRISPLSFAVYPDGEVVYYDEKERKGYLIGKDSKNQIFQHGPNEGQVKNPANMIYSDGRIYVCDTDNSRVEIFNRDGKYLSYFGGKAGFLEKSKEGKFSSPLSLTVDKKGNVYVADTGNAMVQVFNKEGIFLFAIGPVISNFKLINLIDIKSDEGGNLYLLDSKLKKVIVTDSNGKYLSSWDITGIDQPVSFDYDNRGFFYFLDAENGRVNVYDKKGNYQLSFFTKGYGDRELNDSHSIKIVNGILYISDVGGNKLASFKINYIPPRPSSLSASIDENSIKISWQIENPSIVKEYKVFRGIQKDKLEVIDKTTELAYSDKNLESGVTYYYQISAVSHTGQESAGEVYVAYFKGKTEVKQEIEQESEESLKNKPPVEIIPVELNYIFSANYKYYLNNPVGSIYIKNNTLEKFNNIKVSFFLKDYMDFPSDFIVSELLPMSSAYVELKATLNNKVLGINEDTPVQAQLSISYYRDEKENTFNLNQPIKILSRNAITWDNAQRIANFITIKDPFIDSFSKFMLSQKNDFGDESRIDPNLLSAIIIWENLSAYGISYVSDPVNPYATVKSSSALLTDTIQFPRNTLKLKSGDCDDMTVLLATFLESAGIRVVILDYPGHIALMAEMQGKDKSEVGLPDNYIISYENKYFVPIETTMIGKNLYDSIVYAANMYKQYKNEVKFFELRSAMQKFEPVTLPDPVDEIKTESLNVKEKISKTIEYILAKRFEYYEKLYKKAIDENPQDTNSLVNLGVLYALNARLEEAQKIFEKIIEKDSYSALAFNNLGNIYYLKNDYAMALENYMKASKIDPFDDGIFLNMARASVKSGKKEDAKIFIERALKINPDLKNVADEILK